MDGAQDRHAERQEPQTRQDGAAIPSWFLDAGSHTLFNAQALQRIAELSSHVSAALAWRHYSKNKKVAHPSSVCLKMQIISEV